MAPNFEKGGNSAPNFDHQRGRQIYNSLMQEIDSIGQIHISVADVNRAVAWYRDVLGLKFLFEVPGQPMAFFQCGDTRLYLGKPENEDFRSRPVHYFNVSDIESAVETIEARGAVFEDRPHVVHRDAVSEMWLAGTRDPDGNPVMLMETRLLS